jgi:hypothetical protein
LAIRPAKEGGRDRAGAFGHPARFAGARFHSLGMQRRLDDLRVIRTGSALEAD